MIDLRVKLNTYNMDKKFLAFGKLMNIFYVADIS